jgi:hypothetical protein
VAHGFDVAQKIVGIDAEPQNSATKAAYWEAERILTLVAWMRRTAAHRRRAAGRSLAASDLKQRIPLCCNTNPWTHRRWSGHRGGVCGRTLRCSSTRWVQNLIVRCPGPRRMPGRFSGLSAAVGVNFSHSSHVPTTQAVRRSWIVMSPPRGEYVRTDITLLRLRIGRAG